jgi:hypothetical protein
MNGHTQVTQGPALNTNDKYVRSHCLEIDSSPHAVCECETAAAHAYVLSSLRLGLDNAVSALR